MTTMRTQSRPTPRQELCIDLPGEAVGCWRSSDSLIVVLRKHRDVFFDINLVPGTIYTVEAMSSFYLPGTKKLAKKIDFKDGDRLHLWVGRDFSGSLVLKQGASVIGSFLVSTLDTQKYGPDPKVKPEPLMVVIGKREKPMAILPELEDPFHARKFQNLFDPHYDPRVAILSSYGAKQNYKCERAEPDIQEYACVTEAVRGDIQPHVLEKLDAGSAIEAPVTEIFNVPEKGNTPTGLYSALATTIANVSKNDVLTSIWFKESAGYLQENWRMLDKVLMKARVEPRAKGKYKVVFKGHLLSHLAKQVAGKGPSKITHRSMAMGSKASSFIDGGFSRSGSSAYGGFRRMIVTVAENYRGGVKVQAIGTVIDIIVDINDVYLKEDGSRDLSEFLGRAGVSIVKAGATAALASVFTAFGVAGAAALFPGGLFVIVGVAIAVAGLFLAAYVIDKIDDNLGVKESVAGWAR